MSVKFDFPYVYIPEMEFEMKKFYINGRFLLQKVTGEQRFAIEIIKQLDHYVCEKEKWEILAPHGEIITDLELSNISIKIVGRLKGHLWEQVELPIYSQDGFLINFCDMAPIMKKDQVVFIHDMAIMAHPEYYTYQFRKWHEFVYRRTTKNAKKIFTVSQFSKSELTKYMGISPEKVSVIHPACSPHLQQGVFLDTFIEKWGIDPSKKILLAVSSLSPNKNFKTIVEATKYLTTSSIELIIAGGSNTAEFKSTIDEYIDDVKYVGYVSDEELITLYKVADCFIYPSFYEGFGLPPLEAMAHGCAVVLSDSTALPEVYGDAVIYCDPYNPIDVAEKIDTVFQDEHLLKKLVSKGDEKIKEYTWEKSAKMLRDEIYKLVCTA